MNKNGNVAALIIILVIGILVIGGIAYITMYAFTEGSETITVKDKWVKYHGEDAKYLISTTNDQVFQITDSIIFMRFDSSNMYAKLDAGDTCEITTQGWRLGLMSDYKNIIEAEC